jgi:hypothetical protein
VLVFADATTESSLFGIAAVVTAVGGVVTTVLAHRKGTKEAKAKADEECYQRLRATREESEKLASELHSLKMRQFE